MTGQRHHGRRARLQWLQSQGYGGMVGLEYKPTGTTETSLAEVLAT